MLRLGQRSLARLASTDATQTLTSATRNARASNLVDSIVRVDHAGELGADRIYAGQMAVLGKRKIQGILPKYFLGFSIFFCLFVLFLSSFFKLHSLSNNVIQFHKILITSPLGFHSNFVSTKFWASSKLKLECFQI